TSSTITSFPGGSAPASSTGSARPEYCRRMPPLRSACWLRLRAKPGQRSRAQRSCLVTVRRVQLARCKRFARRTVEDHAGDGLEARAVAGAIPGLLFAAPAHHAAHVRATRIMRVQGAGTIAIDGDAAQSLADHRAIAGRELPDVGDVGRRDPVAVLRSGVEVLAQPGTGAGPAAARGIVEFGPVVAATLDQVGQQQGSERAVGEAVARVAGDQVDIVLAWVGADEGQAVGGFQDLPRPRGTESGDRREMFARPGLQAHVGLRIVVLSDLVVVATDNDQHLSFVAALQQADVVI